LVSVSKRDRLFMPVNKKLEPYAQKYSISAGFKKMNVKTRRQRLMTAANFINS